MAKFMVSEGSYYDGDRLHRPGTEIDIPGDRKPPRHLVPTDDASKAQYEKFHGTETPKRPAKQAPQDKPVVPKREPDAVLSMREMQTQALAEAAAKGAAATK